MLRKSFMICKTFFILYRGKTCTILHCSVNILTPKLYTLFMVKRLRLNVKLGNNYIVQ